MVLTPVAQAVLDAIVFLPLSDRSATMEGAAAAAAAAALRAAADQVVPDEPEIPEGDLTEQAYRHDERYGIRTAFLALANELDPTP
jgi:hypothetical protein